MTSEESNRNVNEDYADLIITYYGNPSILENFRATFHNSTVTIINFFYALGHIPVSQFTDNTMYEQGYSVIPVLHGLVSEESIEASGIKKVRNIPVLNLRGKGVLIGIIDTGIDYTNSIFQYADGTTRIASIWDQTIQSDNYPEKYNYGTVYSREQINMALKNENPYDIVPTRDEIGHGTMIAGVAAGNEVPSSDFYGVATEAEFVIVKLKQAKKYIKEFFRVPETAICYQNNDLMIGAEYLSAIAFELKKPISICIALGTSLGSHSGRGPLSTTLSFIAEYIGFSIEIAAGNEGNARRHYYGEIDPTIGYNTVELNVGEGEQGFTMQLWGDVPSTLSIDILSPSGEYEPRMTARLNENRTVSFLFDQTTVNVDFQTVETHSGWELIMVRFMNPAPGIWKFNVFGRGDIQMSFHIWLPSTGLISDNTYFVKSDPYTTVLTPANALLPITINAYNPEDDSLYQEVSRGYSITSDIKPDLVAPGVRVVAPDLQDGFLEATGTSISAAHTTGVAAMLLEWGIVKGNLPDMNTIVVKSLMLRGVRRDIDLVYPNREWGYGILDVFNIFESLITER